jgi:putative DNA primase/helicase
MLKLKGAPLPTPVSSAKDSPTQISYNLYRIHDTMERSRIAHRWSQGISDSVIARLTSTVDPISLEPQANGISVRNGYLMWTGKLLPHDPATSNNHRIEIGFDPLATECPNWDWLLQRVFPEDSLELAWKFLTWLVFPDIRLQRAVLLYGPGANGKSTLFNIIQRLLVPEDMVSNASLESLQSNRFTSVYLMGKSVNICGDISSEEAPHSGVFKAITGQDTIWAERKHGEQFSFRPFCRLVFSSNFMPRSRDASEAYWRRWVIIPFLQKFSGEFTIDELVERLSPAQELSAVLNRCLALRESVRQGGLPLPPSVKQVVEDFSVSQDSFVLWSEILAEDSDGEILKESLYVHYEQFLRRSNRPPLPRSEFFKRLREEFPNIEESQSRANGRRRIIRGLSWKAQGT